MSDQDGHAELYKKHRPTKLSQLYGQDDAVRTLRSFRGAVPHFLLLVGPSGCGKTTTARILQRLLRCSDADFQELNCAADARGIDAVREIQQRMGFAPLGGESRVWLLDEAGKLTGDAQTALLKTLEDTPSHVWFLLATTDPQKIISTIKTRATVLTFRLLKPLEMTGLLNEVCTAEGFALSEELRDRLVEAAEGSPRKALVLLNQAMRVDTEEGRLAAVSAGVASSKAIDVARALFEQQPAWGRVAGLLKEVEDEPETVRRVVLGYARSVLLGGGRLAGTAYRVIGVFERAWHDGGAASMAACCWEVIHGDGQ